MGIYIAMTISKSVTPEEWTSVYNETLRLVEAFPFSERREVPIRGIKTICLVPTKEREDRYGWNNENILTGWFADGDYETLCTAECFRLTRDRVTKESYDPEAPDAMFPVVASHLGYDPEDPRFHRYYQLWGSKTQGEPYHMYLLAVACLIESRLGSKAYVYGDITKGQCRKAVEMANQYLDTKIDLPARCDPERFLKRIKALPFSEQELLKIYIDLYLGNKDAAFGDTARKQFSEAAFAAYWKKRLDQVQVTMTGFSDILYEYLLWGFDLEKLAGYVSFTDNEGNTHYDDYVRKIMETKIYLKEKDCSDILKIDNEDEQPYGIATQFAQLLFGNAKNRKVDRYIPLDDVRNALLSSIGNTCDVNSLIDQYQDEEDVPSAFTQTMEAKLEALKEQRRQYDIAFYEDLPFFKSSRSINPDLAERAKRYFAFYRGVTKEERFAELMERTPKERCEWLVSQNGSILLRDRDWNRIFGDIMEKKESFSRYYPMVRVKITNDNLIYLIQAIAVNDALYEYLSKSTAPD